MLEIIRGAVRPIVTLLSAVATIAFIAYSIDMPPEWWTMFAMIVAFWFQSRTPSKPS